MTTCTRCFGFVKTWMDWAPAVNLVACLMLGSYWCVHVSSSIFHHSNKLSENSYQPDDICAGMQIFTEEVQQNLVYYMYATLLFWALDLFASICACYSTRHDERYVSKTFGFWISMQLCLTLVVILHGCLQHITGDLNEESIVNHSVFLVWKSLFLIVYCPVYFFRRKSLKERTNTDDYNIVQLNKPERKFCRSSRDVVIFVATFAVDTMKHLWVGYRLIPHVLLYAIQNEPEYSKVCDDDFKSQKYVLDFHWHGIFLYAYSVLIDLLVVALDSARKYTTALDDAGLLLKTVNDAVFIYFGTIYFVLSFQISYYFFSFLILTSLLAGCLIFRGPCHSSNQYET